MMNNFSLEQPIAYKLIKNSIDNDKISHAYLINTNNYRFAWEFVLEMVKSFICPNHYQENECFNCDLCRRIDDGNYPEFKVIDSDGLWIKKNRVLDLQEEFSKIALEGNNRIYVIKHADRMNSQTSNSLLKFLEEPSNNVIAILVTNNLNSILPTIISRCQIINLKNYFDYSSTALENFGYLCVSSDIELSKFINDDNNINIFENVIEFINYYEHNGLNSIVFSKKFWHSKFKDKDVILKVFDLLINFYYDVLLFQSSGCINFFNDYNSLIKEIASINDINDIIRKLSVTIECRDKLKYNVNLNLFFDKFIMLLGGR